MITELLNRWAAVEPSRCRSYQGDLYRSVMFEVLLTIEQRAGWVAIGSFTDIESMTGLAVLQYAIQQAVVARDFRLRLENLPVGWEAIVFAIDDRPSFSPYEQGTEPAIVMLKSYVSFLESQEAIEEQPKK